MSRVHKISATNQWPFNPKKNNGLTDAFALCPESVTGDQFKKFLETLIQYDDHRRKLSLPKEKTVFNHNELDLLPNTPIFGTALSCDSCSFSTKVNKNYIFSIIALFHCIIFTIGSFESLPSLETTH